jgi:ribonuclease P protein component
VVAGKAFGIAVRRNRAKRRLRACIDLYFAGLPAGWDLVFLARKPMDQAGFAEICAGIQQLLKRAGLLNE